MLLCIHGLVILVPLSHQKFSHDSHLKLYKKSCHTTWYPCWYFSIGQHHLCHHHQHQHHRHYRHHHNFHWNDCQCLELLAPVVPHLTSAVLSSNNFSGAAALKVFFMTIIMMMMMMMKIMMVKQTKKTSWGRCTQGLWLFLISFFLHWNGLIQFKGHF